MSSLQHYSKEIDCYLKSRDSFTSNRLFDVYTADSTKGKESFVLALIGRVLMLEARCSSLCDQNPSKKLTDAALSKEEK